MFIALVSIVFINWIPWVVVLKDSLLRLYSQGNSYTQISRQMALSKQLVMKTIRQYVEENKIVTKGPSYMSQRNAQVNIAAANAAAVAAQQRRFSTDDGFDASMFQEGAGDDDDDEYGDGMIDSLFTTIISNQHVFFS